MQLEAGVAVRRTIQPVDVDRGEGHPLFPVANGELLIGIGPILAGLRWPDVNAIDRGACSLQVFVRLLRACFSTLKREHCKRDVLPKWVASLQQA